MEAYATNVCLYSKNDLVVALALDVVELRQEVTRDRRLALEMGNQDLVSKVVKHL